MIEIIYTPFGSTATTEKLLREALGGCRHPDYSVMLYVAPTLLKVRDAQQVFHSLQPGPCYLPPQTVTLGQYCKQLYSFYGDKRVVAHSLIPLILSRLSPRGLGFCALVDDLIRQLKRFHPHATIDSLRSKFMEAFREMNAPEPVVTIAEDCLALFDEYQSFLHDNGLVDESDVLNRSPLLIPAAPAPQMTIVEGFYDPMPAERNVIRALIEHSENALIAIPWDDRFGHLIKDYVSFLKGAFDVRERKIQEGLLPVLDYCAYPGKEEEVEGIARNIKSLYVASKFKELDKILVIFPGLDGYAAMIRRVFKRYGIPYEMSSGEPLGKTGPFVDLLSLLESVAGGYPRLRFSEFLSSGFFTKIPESLKTWIPFLSLRSGVISGRAAWLAAFSGESGIFDERCTEERTTLERDLKRVFKKLQPLEETKAGARLHLHVSVLQKVLKDFGFVGSSGDEEMKNVRDVFQGILEQIAFLDEANEAAVTLAEFCEILKHILNGTHLETEGTGVRVMDFSEVSGLSPHYLYFGGLTDGDMPGRKDMDYLLPDSVKEKLGFVTLEKHLHLQKFDFSRLTASTGNLHLSYPRSDGDDQFLPSPFLYPGEEREKTIPGIFSHEEYLLSKGSTPLSEYLSEVMVQPSLLPFRRDFRVTDIDAYRACPRRFFIERILRLEPSVIKGYEMEALTIGTIVHGIMERLIQEPLRGLEDFTEKADAILREIVRDSKVDAFWKEIIRDVFLAMLPEIYGKELEIRTEGYVSTEVEKTITGEPIPGVRLKGKIDRFDRIGNFVQILDYKTGMATLNCSQVAKGHENLQLFLYAAMMKHQGYAVNRVGVYSLKDIDIKWCPPKRRGRGTDQLDEYVVNALTFLEAAVAGIRRGDFKAFPMHDRMCWMCHEYAFCPYVQQ